MMIPINLYFNIESFKTILLTLLIVQCFGACEKAALPHNESISSPEQTVSLWYKAWQTSNLELLQFVTLDSLKWGAHFGEYSLEYYDIISVDTLDRDFDRSRHIGAEIGDIAIETREFFSDSKFPPMRKYILLRADKSGHWKVVEHSVIYDNNYPPPPED